MGRKIWLFAMAGVLWWPSVGVADEHTGTPEVCQHHEEMWTDTEILAWERLCKLGIVTFPDDLIQSGKKSSEAVLSSAFIRTILTREPHRSQIQWRGIWIRGAHFTEALDLSELSIGSGVRISNSKFSQLIDLSRSRFGGNVSFIGSTLTKGIKFDEARIAGSLFLGNMVSTDVWPVHKAEKVYIDSLTGDEVEVDGSVNVFNAIIGKTAMLPFSRIRGSIGLYRLEAHEITMTSSDVGGQVTIAYSDLSPTKEQVEQYGRHYTLLNLYSIHTFQPVFLNGSNIVGPIDIQDSDIGGLILLGSKLQSIRADGVSVRGTLVLGSLNLENDEFSPTTWSGSSMLDLKNSSIGTISAPWLARYWPEKVDFTNFSVRALTSDGYQKGEAPEPSSTWFPELLAREQQFIPQPYNMVMSVLNSSGDDVGAAAVGYSKRDFELSEAFHHRDILRLIYLVFSKVTIGYGYQMWLPIAWMFAFIVLGTYVFKFANETNLKTFAQRFAQL
jgi:hypothetical protein